MFLLWQINVSLAVYPQLLVVILEVFLHIFPDPLVHVDSIFLCLHWILGLFDFAVNVTKQVIEQLNALMRAGYFFSEFLQVMFSLEIYIVDDVHHCFNFKHDVTLIVEEFLLLHVCLVWNLYVVKMRWRQWDINRCNSITIMGIVFSIHLRVTSLINIFQNRDLCWDLEFHSSFICLM